MADFIELKDAISRQFKRMDGAKLYRTDVTGDELWDHYLTSFKPQDNPIFRERTEHDCSCCRGFIKNIGNVVSIVGDNVVSIWDIEADDPGYMVSEGYRHVAQSMSDLVTSRPIKDVFLYGEDHIGVDHNRELTESGEVLRWTHFHVDLPAAFVSSDIPTKLNHARGDRDVFLRSMVELKADAGDAILDLIEQGSLYRGDQYKKLIQDFLHHKAEFESLSGAEAKNVYSWKESSEMGSSARFRNTAIGQLLIDLSEGVELDHAVRSFETMVAPTNYQRPKALVTKGMIDRAYKKVTELGIADALPRRFATVDDIALTDVIYADREVKKAKNVFEELAASVPEPVKNFDKVEEVNIETFIRDIVPRASSLEVFVENRLTPNFMSLAAPCDSEAPSILQWDNNFTWSYNGGVTDSIKARVKNAGGNVDGVLRVSLSWSNYDDLDIHVVEPDGNRIYFSNKRSSSSGSLDVDMNAGGPSTRTPVENIVWTDEARMKPGEYIVQVNNFNAREAEDVGFEVEVEGGVNGFLKTYSYPKRVSHKETVTVARFAWSELDGVRILDSIAGTDISKGVWGLNTGNFVKVNLAMSSPNYWGDNRVGNKHWFFILSGCRNDEPIRGFYNEFLRSDLREHRKVFEVLGSKMKAEVSDNQLSGLGFSSTQRNSFLCRVSGSFNRVIKVVI